jgi:AraC-like DNA-binding protein
VGSFVPSIVRERTAWKIEKMETARCEIMGEMLPVAARYREFQPCPSLRPFVRAYFTFLAPPNHMEEESRRAHPRITREILRREGDPFWSALFADGHVSIVFYSGIGYRIEGLWHPSPNGPRTHVIGAMSSVRGTAPGDRLIQVGAYFRAAQAAYFAAPSRESTDRAVALEHFWGRAATAELEQQLDEAREDSDRIAHLEAALLRRATSVRDPKRTLDLPGLAALAQRQPIGLTVEAMANLAGVSRQYLTRAFREDVGVTPKLYCRLSRFRAALKMATQRPNLDGANLAAMSGYADQAHMIAEFRRFCGMTPALIRRGGSFHPFAEQDSRRRPEAF